MALAGALTTGLAACSGDSDDSQDAATTAAAGSDAATSETSGTDAATVPGTPETTGCAGVDGIAGLSGADADPEAVRRAAAATLAVGVTGFDDAAAAVDAGVRHLFIGSSTDRTLLDGQGDPDRSLAALQQRAAEADGPDSPGITVSVDEEGGQVQRLADLTGTLPSAREIAGTMSPEETTEMFTEHARKLRELGITMDFAPDTDLDAGGDVSDNAIGDRAFSSDPAVVVTYGRAVIDGLLAGGVTPVIKHFPGHGHATGDSHTGAVSTPPLDELGPDMQPFAELSQVPGVEVMVGHMQVPGLDVTDDTGAVTVAGADTPSSLNPASFGLLRDGVEGAPGYTGVIFTDDLTGMQAVTDNYSAGDAVVTALRAGADAPLVSSGVDAAAVTGILDAVAGAVADGSLDLGRVAEAGSRVCTGKTDPAAVTG